MFLDQEHMEFPIFKDIVDKLSKLIIMEKVIFCCLILIIIFVIYSYNKLKLKEFFTLNLLGIEYDKRLYVGNQKDWSHKLKKGDLSVNGVTETNNYCIHDKNNNYGQNQTILHGHQFLLGSYLQKYVYHHRLDYLLITDHLVLKKPT